MKEKENYLSLVSLRGLFILMIIVYHMGDNFGTIFDSALGWCYYWGGHLGNTFFFVVSGFLMTHGYSTKIVNGNLSFIDFFKRRIVKIFPLYVITNLLRLGISLAVTGLEALKFDELLRVLFMAASGWVANNTPYNNPTWFVCVLMLVYIVYFFLTLVKRKSKDVYFLLIFLLMMYGRSLYVMGLPYPFMRSGDGQGLYCFMIGVALYELVDSAYGRLKNTVLICGNVLSLGCCLLCLCNGIASVAADVPMVIAFLLIPTILLDAVLCKTIRKFFQARPFVFIGEISMSLFFIHGLWIALFKLIQSFVVVKNECVWYALVLTTLIAVSALSHNFLEPTTEKVFSKLFKRTI